jgi:hypothetical protein
MPTVTVLTPPGQVVVFPPTPATVSVPVIPAMPAVVPHVATKP